MTRRDQNAAQLSVISATSPELYHQLAHETQQLVMAINTHTVNLVEMVSYVQQLSFVSLQDIQKEFGFKDEDMEEV